MASEKRLWGYYMSCAGLDAYVTERRECTGSANEASGQAVLNVYMVSRGCIAHSSGYFAKSN